MKWSVNTQLAADDADIEELRDGTDNLLKSGVEIMKNYAIKYPACEIQFQQIMDELATAKSKTAEVVTVRYLDGVGLPESPEVCNYGRLQVGLPLLIRVQLNKQLTKDARMKIVNEFRSAIVNSANIIKKLKL